MTTISNKYMVSKCTYRDPKQELARFFRCTIKTNDVNFLLISQKDNKKVLPSNILEHYG